MAIMTDHACRKWCTDPHSQEWNDAINSAQSDNLENMRREMHDGFSMRIAIAMAIMAVAIAFNNYYAEFVK